MEIYLIFNQRNRSSITAAYYPFLFQKENLEYHLPCNIGKIPTCLHSACSVDWCALAFIEMILVVALFVDAGTAYQVVGKRTLAAIESTTSENV